MAETPTVYVDLEGRFTEFERQLSELQSSSAEAGESSGSAFSGAFTTGMKIAAGAAVALAGAVIAIGASSLGLAQEAAQNVNEFQSKLGATREEAEKLGTVAEQVFGDNWTGSLTEAGEAVATVRKEISGLADEDLRAVTGGVVAIAETFEQEQGSIAAAVDSLMKSTGVSAQEATDFITKGFQKGLDSSGDFLDTLNEYAPQFEKSKIGAGELFSLLETGAAKGALGTDKVADAFKEFGLTVVGVSDDSKSVYKELGLNQELLVKGINDGTLSQSKAFDLVSAKLADVKGQADRTRIGAAIFGGAGEDFANGLSKLDLTKTKMSDIQGATESLNRRYENFGNLFSGISRQLQLSLLPVGKELLSLANDAVPYLQRASAWLGERLPGWIKAGLDGVKAFGTGAINTYNTLKPSIDAVASTFQKTSAFIERNKEVLIPLTAAVGAGAAAFGAYRLGVAAVTLATGLWTAAQTAAAAASVVLRAALTFITGPVGLVIAAITLLVGAGVALYRNWDEVKAFAIKTWGQIKEIVTNAIGGAVTFLKSINMKEIGLQIVQGLVNGILAGPALVLRAARGLGQSVIDGVKGILNIKSPSVVMVDAGDNVGQGLANGITKTTPIVQKAAAGLGKAVISEVEKARQALEQDISTDKWVTSLKNVTTARLQEVQAAARAAGEAEKYNAIKSELARREDAHTNAIQKNTEAAKGQADELARNRAQIVSGEQAEKYAEGLRSATSAQLDAARATAKNAGEVEKYNTIKSEQQRRDEEAQKVLEESIGVTMRLADATRQAAEEIASNRRSILDGEAFARYAESLGGYSDATLDAARSNALAAGDSQKYNVVLGEQKRRADEAAQAISDLVDQQIRGSNSRYADVEGATDSAYRQTYGAGDVGLIRSLADTTGLSVERIRADVFAALADAKKFAPQAATIIERVWADALTHRRETGEAERAEIAATSKAEQDAYQAARKFNLDTLGSRTDAGLLRLYDEATAQRDGDLMARVAEEIGKRVESLNGRLNASYAEQSAARITLIKAQYEAQDNGPDYAAIAAELEFQKRPLADLIALAEDYAKGTDAAAVAARTWLDSLKAAADLDARLNASAAEASQTRIGLIKQVYDDEQDAAEDASITVASLTGNIRDLIQQGLDPRKSGFTDWLDELEKKGGRAGEAAAQTKKNLNELILAARFAQATPGALDGPVEARRTAKPILPPTSAERGLTVGGTGFGGDDAAFQQRIYATEQLERYRKSLEQLSTSQLENERVTALNLNQQDRYTVVIGVQADKTKQQEERSKGLAEAQATVADAQTNLNAVLTGAVTGPYQGQIDTLTKLKGKYPEVTDEVDKLIAKLTELDSKAKQQKALEGKINEFSQYAQKLIPVVTGAMQALGGVTSEAAAQWASDLGNMVSDLTNFGLAIAKGDYLGAAIQALTTIFGWFTRNKKAAEDAAKATQAYNDQFKFDAAGYGTRVQSSYTTGFLFWTTTHYTEQIDKLKRDIALSLEGGFTNGVKDGFAQALEQNDFSLFEKSLKTSVGKAVLEGLIESFINQAVLARIIGPAIDAYLQNGDAAALQTAIRAASGEAQNFYDTVLKPIAQEFGLLGSGQNSAGVTQADGGSFANVQVTAPITAQLNFDVLGTFSSVVATSAPLYAQGGRDTAAGGAAVLQGAGVLVAVADRFDRLLTRQELSANGRWNQ